jgi:hypothetical protein
MAVRETPSEYGAAFLTCEAYNASGVTIHFKVGAPRRMHLRATTTETLIATK